MPFTVRPTGNADLDRVQAEIRDAFGVLEATLTQALQQLAAACAPAPSGATPGTYAPPASITVNTSGIITKIS